MGDKSDSNEVPGIPESENTSPPSSKRSNPPPGSVLEVKPVYGHKNDKGEWRWKSDPPENIPTADEKQDTTQFALISRNIPSQDSDKHLEVHSVIVQSPVIKKLLEEHVLKNYPSISFSLSRLVFAAPFAPFVHRWASLLKCKAKKFEDEVRSQFHLLYDFLHREVSDNIKALDDYRQSKAITFDHLWMIFEPQKLVVSEANGEPSAYELISATYKSTEEHGRYFMLQCQHIDWDGRRFGRRITSLAIFDFHGTQDIDSLSVVPLNFVKDKKSLENTLIVRGRKFESLTGHNFRR
jgi:hypothetical protein